MNNSNFARYHKSSLPFVQVCLANDVMKTHIVNYGSKITYLYLSLLYLRLFYGITFIEIRPCKGKNSQKSKIREAKLQKYKVRKKDNRLTGSGWFTFR